MKKTRICLIITSLLLVCVMSINLIGCTAEEEPKSQPESQSGSQPESMMDGITPNEVDVIDDLGMHNADVTDFAIRLFKANYENGENTLISPLSVLCALAMTTNGAEGETQAQMETVLGITAKELNPYLYSYMSKLSQGDTYKLHLANSIWFADKDSFSINPDFLQLNADYYGADIYKAPFDNQTCNNINNWVKEKTDGMIPEIVDAIPKDAIMYLINALSFDAEWAETYEDSYDDIFTKEDGTEQNAEFMFSVESTYLEDEKATGFIKYYDDGKYAFVALLPNEGISVSEYIDFLNGDSLYALLTNPQKLSVEAELPKFETGYDTEMSDTLKAMGMPKAFDSANAEFGKLGSSGENNIFISRVLHKTFISVAENGTKAGAATAVEMNECAALPEEDPVEYKKVILNRPFVYMLIDCENNIPFFIGTMMDIEG